jgi:beta-galactosidase
MYEVGYYYQNIWTTPVDLKKGEIEVYNEHFFRDLSAYCLEWEVLKGGEAVRSGRIEDLNVQPQQRARLTLPIGETCQCAEWLLNVKFKLKNREGLLPAGSVVAYDQLTLNAYKAPEVKNAESLAAYNPTAAPTVKDNDTELLIVNGAHFTAEFNRHTGYLTRYAVDGTELLAEEAALTPNFWRAPTDNDYGAGLQRKFKAWKNPGAKLTSLASSAEEGKVVVKATYELEAVKAQLALTYSIGAEGDIVVTEQMTATAGAEVSQLFRFGMQLQMPKTFDKVAYYGRGPIENYADRKDCMPLGIYRQTVDEQFYPYIRPQETGTKSDLRWWRVLNTAGKGIEVVAEKPFSASALAYTIDSLDDGDDKHQSHSPEVPQADFTNVCIDLAQMGLGCVNSWGAWPREEYLLPYGDYSFRFVIRPVSKK